MAMDEDEEMKKKREDGLEVLIDYTKGNGLVPVVVQDYSSGRILMLAYANQEALESTFETGYATFWKRSEQRLWTKGETSGNMLAMEEILVDCDQDALLYRVRMEGEGACHTKVKGKSRISCFYRKIAPNSKKLEF